MSNFSVSPVRVEFRGTSSFDASYVREAAKFVNAGLLRLEVAMMHDRRIHEEGADLVGRLTAIHDRLVELSAKGDR